MTSISGLKFADPDEIHKILTNLPMSNHNIEIDIGSPTSRKHLSWRKETFNITKPIPIRHRSFPRRERTLSNVENDPPLSNKQFDKDDFYIFTFED